MLIIPVCMDVSCLSACAVARLTFFRQSHMEEDAERRSQAVTVTLSFACTEWAKGFTNEDSSIPLRWKMARAFMRARRKPRDFPACSFTEKNIIWPESKFVNDSSSSMSDRRSGEEPGQSKNRRDFLADIPLNRIVPLQQKQDAGCPIVTAWKVLPAACDLPQAGVGLAYARRWLSTWEVKRRAQSSTGRRSYRCADEKFIARRQALRQ